MTSEAPDFKKRRKLLAGTLKQVCCFIADIITHVVKQHTWGKVSVQEIKLRQYQPLESIETWESK